MTSGLSAQEAARHAGFSPSYAKKSSRLLKYPAIVAAVAGIRMEGRKLAAYDLKTAMREAEEVCAFARANRNAMAHCKGTELRAKLSRLLVDRVEVANVDLKGVLDRAAARVIQLNVPPHSVLATARRWFGTRGGQPPWRRSRAGAQDKHLGSNRMSMDILAGGRRMPALPTNGGQPRWYAAQPVSLDYFSKE
jgi:phage terminase small subunit